MQCPLRIVPSLSVVFLLILTSCELTEKKEPSDLEFNTLQVVGVCPISSAPAVGTASATTQNLGGSQSSSIHELQEKVSNLSENEIEKLLAEFHLNRPHMPNELLLKFKEGTSHSLISDTLSALQADVVYEFNSDGSLHIQLPLTFTKESLIVASAFLNQLDSLGYVEPNSIFSIDNFPNDPRFSEVYGLYNFGQGIGTAGADIGAVDAWKVQTGSKTVVVGVLDTGVNYNHPDLKDNIWINSGEFGPTAAGVEKSTNGIDDDNNGFIDDFRGWNFAGTPAEESNDPMDVQGHGTHVAGTIGARGNNGIGVVGVNWQVSIAAIRWLDPQGSGLLSDAVQAIDYATAMRIPITNNSWGGPDTTNALQSAVQRNQQAGLLFVAAAGNSRANNDTTSSFPANYNFNNIISVAAIDADDDLAYFSNYGLARVHIGAPGFDILSTTLPSTDGAIYGLSSGTSMAAPFVAGAAALIKAQFPDATYTQIRNRILQNATPIPSLNGRTTTGGKLNVARAILTDTIAPGRVTDLKIMRNSLATVEFSWTPVKDDNQAGPDVISYQVRYSTKGEIRSEADWQTATIGHAILNIKEGTASGAISRVPLKTQGWLAIRAEDRVGNLGPISPSVAFKLVEAKILYENKATTIEGVTVTGAWGIETPTDRPDPVFSDSPTGTYVNNRITALTLPHLTISEKHRDLVLEFEHSVDVENFLDDAIVQISTDEGKSWRQLGKFSAQSCGWVKTTLSLYEQIPAGTGKVQVRFVLDTSPTTARDGWKIDNIVIYEEVAPPVKTDTGNGGGSGEGEPVNPVGDGNLPSGAGQANGQGGQAGVSFGGCLAIHSNGSGSAANAFSLLIALLPLLSTGFSILRRRS